MKYVYLVTHDYDYEGHSVVTIETSAKKAIAAAEKELNGDYTTVTKYVIGGGEYESTMIAQWKHDWSSGNRKYKRMKV